MWVGEKYYTPTWFIDEAKRMGVSKAVSGIPAWLEPGKTWIYLVHRKGGTRVTDGKTTKVPAVFCAFKPSGFEMLVTESEQNDSKYLEMEKRGVELLIVPDDYNDLVEDANERAEFRYHGHPNQTSVLEF